MNTEPEVHIAPRMRVGEGGGFPNTPMCLEIHPGGCLMVVGWHPDEVIVSKCTFSYHFGTHTTKILPSALAARSEYIY